MPEPAAAAVVMPRITTPMIALAWSVVNCAEDREQVAVILAQMILAVAERGQ